jgi:hypothetical protein
MSPLLNRGGTFVTIITPVFRNADKYGVISGLSRAAYKAAEQTIYVRSKICKTRCLITINRVYQMVLIIVGQLMQLMEMFLTKLKILLNKIK